MKTRNAGWMGLAALLAISPIRGNSQTPGAPPDAAATAQVTLSPGAAEVVKLAQSGVSDDVVLAYIQNSQSAFTLSSDGVVYLKDLGLSPAVITAMLNHDTSLNHQPQYTYDQKPYPATIPPPALEPAAAPAAPEVATAQPAVAPPDQPAPPPVYDNNPPVEVNYFYNDLAPYGSWVNLPGYGWCWQPSAVVINRGWRPYCDGGHWVYSDAGWFWQSDYSWGWAPFHYGRWRMDERCGWVWFPDRVWGPAWVSWRSSGDHCGWAPLPLHAVFDVGGGFRFNGVRVGADFDFGLGVNLFTFVSLRDFHDHDLGHRRLPPTEVTKIYNHTTIINNYTVENKIIVNRGIDARRVEEATHVPERRIAVRDVPAGREMPRGGATAVYRHELGAPVRTGPIVAQRVDERHPVIQHDTLSAVHVEHRVTPGNTLPHSQPAQGTSQTLQQQREVPHRETQAVPQPHQPAQVMPQPLQQQREVPQREIHTVPQPQPQPGNQRYTPPDQNQTPPQNQEHRTGNSVGATVPNATAPRQPMQPAVPEQHYAPTPNAVQRQTVAPQTHVEQPDLVTHDYVPRSARLATEAHMLSPANQPVPTYHSAPAPAQSEPRSQPGNSGGNGNAGGNSHTGGGNGNSGGNSGGNGNNGGNNNSSGGRNDRGNR